MAAAPSPESAPIPVSGPETLGDPVLIEADELLKRYAEQNDKKADRLEGVDGGESKNIRVRHLDAALTKMEGKIAEEEKKAPPDYDKLGNLKDRQARLTETRNEIIARPEERADKKEGKVKERLEEAARETEGRLKEIENLKNKITELTEKAATLKGSKDPKEQSQLSDIYKQIAQETRELQGLEKQGSEEEQKERLEARRAMAKKAEAMREAAHNWEVKIAEKEVSDFMEGKEGPADGERPAEGSEESLADEERAVSEARDDSEKRQELLHDMFNKIAYGLAVGLVHDYKVGGGNAFENIGFQFKVMALRITSAIGGSDQWALPIEKGGLLTAHEAEFLEKKVGMTCSEKPDEKGPSKMKASIEWKEPLEGWEPVDTRILAIYERAYGKEGAEAALKKVESTTTVAALEASVTDPTSKEGQATLALIAAMKANEAKTDTVVLNFLSEKRNQIVGSLNKPTEAASSTLAAVTTASAVSPAAAAPTTTTATTP